jgi:hypothetical protein
MEAAEKVRVFWLRSAEHRRSAEHGEDRGGEYQGEEWARSGHGSLRAKV